MINMPFRILWVLAIPVGASYKLSFVWLLSDTLNALMAIPNLIALLLLSGTIFKLTRGSRLATKGDLDAPAPEVPE